MFSSFFLLLADTTGNSLMFGKHILLAFEPDQPVDARLQNFIAICILTLTCLVNYFSTASGRLLNRGFSIYKLALMVIVFVAGFVTAAPRNAPVNLGIDDFSAVHTLSDTPAGDYAAAYLLVLYSYQGWENSNYVSLLETFTRGRNWRE